MFAVLPTGFFGNHVQICFYTHYIVQVDADTLLPDNYDWGIRIRNQIFKWEIALLPGQIR